MCFINPHIPEAWRITFLKLLKLFHISRYIFFNNLFMNVVVQWIQILPSSFRKGFDQSDLFDKPFWTFYRYLRLILLSEATYGSDLLTCTHNNCMHNFLDLSIISSHLYGISKGAQIFIEPIYVVSVYFCSSGAQIFILEFHDGNIKKRKKKLWQIL